VLGVLQRGIPVEGVDRRQAVVAGAGSVAAIGIEVGEERADQRRIQILEVQLEGLLAGLLVSIGQEQTDRVAVRGDRFGAGVALG